MIDVIITKNPRPASGCAPLTYYSAGGVFLSLNHKGFKARWVDISAGQSKARFNDISCYAVFFGNKVSALAHMKKVRSRKDSQRRIIAFGPFAAAFSEEILSRKLADIIVSADAEFVIPSILSVGHDNSSLSAIPNLSYIHNDTVVTTAKHSFDQLDDLPFIGSFLYGQGDRPAHMMTSRGCQYHCVFCERNAMWGGGVRKRSVENVLNEIQELVLKYQVREIRFLDEDLAADQKRLVKICEGIRRINGNFKWECSACVDSVSKELLILMGLSRCGQVNFGVESASPKVLQQLGKRYGREAILNSVLWAREAGMKVEIMLTIGNPGETDDDRSLTLSMLNEIGPDVQIRTNRLVILPGTALYRKGLREKWFTQEEFYEDEGLVFYNDKGLINKI